MMKMMMISMVMMPQVNWNFEMVVVKPNWIVVVTVRHKEQNLEMMYHHHHPLQHHHQHHQQSMDSIVVNLAMEHWIEPKTDQQRLIDPTRIGIYLMAEVTQAELWAFQSHFEKGHPNRGNPFLEVIDRQYVSKMSNQKFSHSIVPTKVFQRGGSVCKSGIVLLCLCLCVGCT